jgi:hypothetical protein
MNNRSLLILFCLLFFNIAYSQQEHFCKEFGKLSRPEKCWALWHPFIAKKAFEISMIARKVTDSMKQASVLDRDVSGGQLDAFRHSYWMLMVSMRFNTHKALSLGKAHEKGNYLDYKKHHLEEGIVPDSISSQMDLYNNKKGIEIGKRSSIFRKRFITKRYWVWQKPLLDSISAGKMMIIKKNKKGEFLDLNGNIIPSDSLKNKWSNKECLVPSNFKRPE